MMEKTLESPLDYKEIQPVHPKGNQSWIFIGRIDAEAETPILWPADAKNWLIGKDPDAGKDWRQEEKGKTEDEMVGWHHRLNRHVWVNSGSWWWRGRPGMLWYMGLQGVRHNWAAKLNWTETVCNFIGLFFCKSLIFNPWSCLGSVLSRFGKGIHCLQLLARESAVSLVFHIKQSVNGEAEYQCLHCINRKGPGLYWAPCPPKAPPLNVKDKNSAWLCKTFTTCKV